MRTVVPSMRTAPSRAWPACWRSWAVTAWTTIVYCWRSSSASAKRNGSRPWLQNSAIVQYSGRTPVVLAPVAGVPFGSPRRGGARTRTERNAAASKPSRA